MNARTTNVHNNSLSVSVCPSANAYEMSCKNNNKRFINTVKDTTIVLTSATDFVVNDIVNFAVS